MCEPVYDYSDYPEPEDYCQACGYLNCICTDDDPDVEEE